MDKELIAAFQNIEKQIEKKQKQIEQDKVARVEREKFLQVQKELEISKKRQEKLIYFSVACFLFGMIYVIQLSRGAARSEGKTVSAWAGGVVKNVVEGIIPDEMDCGKPDNWRDPYCVEKRKMETELEWKSISFNKDGNDVAFPVNRTK
jgi:hypothetical protein